MNNDGVTDLVDSGHIYLGPFTPLPSQTLSAPIEVWGPEANFRNDGTTGFPFLHGVNDYPQYVGFVRRAAPK